MTDPTRHADRTPDAPSGGDPRVDALLIEGLEHYFAGQFEHAIHLWTRVLFLDRHHVSARAYIERARGAIAERQRRADESLQAVARLLDEGRAAEARVRLTTVITTAGDDERTAALRLRLERLERVIGGSPRIHAAPLETSAWWRHGMAVANYRVRLHHAAAAAVLLCLFVLGASPAVQQWLGLRSVPDVPVQVPVAAVVPVPTTAEVALIRARALYARGRLAEALGALERVAPEQAQRADADKLRVEIQRVLLAGVEGRR
ncbi:MAG: hypothetical protein FJW21_07680 [Acidimicrobiia bacterium]|nr:hypothetical protein [Acidimicrobiia bacterium]